MKFKLLLPDGNAINQNTLINYSTGKKKISTDKKLCLLIKSVWKKETSSKSFTDWATSLNESGEFEGTFTKFDALDNLSSLFQLNIDNKHVNLYDYFIQTIPFKN